MRTCELQCFLLVVMMAAMFVYSTPVFMHTNADERRELLDQMKTEATKLRNKLPKGICIPKMVDSTKTCVGNFFCLAEKALNSINNSAACANTTRTDTSVLSKLMRSIKQFNFMTNKTQCSLKTNVSYSSPSQFFEDLRKCANKFR